MVQPFEKLVEGVVKDEFIKNWLDLLCFLLSGLPANGTIAAEVCCSSFVPCTRNCNVLQCLFCA